MVYRLARMVHGYPLQTAGEYTASTFTSLEAGLQALGEHVEVFGYAGTFNPVHPAATDYYLVARSTKDSSLVLVTPDTEN